MCEQIRNGSFKKDMCENLRSKGALKEHYSELCERFFFFFFFFFCFLLFFCCFLLLFFFVLFSCFFFFFKAVFNKLRSC